MATVQEVKAMWSDETSGADVNRRWYDITYQVTFDVPAEQNAILARQATGVPRVGDRLAADPWMACTNVGNATAKGPTLFHVPVHYETPSGAGSTEGTNPLDDPAEIRWFGATTTEPIEIDRDGNPILNTADEWLDPPIEIELDDAVVQVVRNVATFAADMAIEYRKTVNADDFHVNGYKVLEGMAKLITYDGELIRDETGDVSFDYYRETIEIAFRENGWSRRRLQQGYRERLTSTEGGEVKYKTITDKDGNPISSPVMLDIDGLKLAAGAAPVFVDYDVLVKRPFALLNLPT